MKNPTLHWSLQYARLWWSSLDKTTVGVVLGLMFFGWLEMCFVSSAIGGRMSVDPVMFWGKQTAFVLIGACVMLFFSAMPMNLMAKVSLLSFVVLLLLLVFVSLFGDVTKGSRRWIRIFGVNAQPSDLMKPFFIVVNGMILGNNKVNLRFAVLTSAGLLMFIAVLLFLEPDVGMLITYLCVWCMQTAMANVPLKFYGLAAVAVPPVGLLAYFSLPHIRYRIGGFVSGVQPYQVQKSLMSMANGGFFGKGLGDGEIKYQLPDAHSDYIFSAIGEEGGLVACLALLLAYLFLILNSVRQIMWEENAPRRIVGFGLIATFFVHVCMSVGVSLNVLPPKGTTLPFISYGGSSIVSACICAGMLLALFRQKNCIDNTFDRIKKKYFWDYLLNHQGRVWQREKKEKE